jgi:putative hydrolase of the HAD superfamily
MARFKAVFFDAAGTLFDTRQPVGETYAREALRYGLSTKPEAVEAAFHQAFRESPPLAFGPGHEADELRRLEREWWRELVAKTFAGFGEFSNFVGYFNFLFEFFADPAHWVVDPETIATLRKLREQGLVLGVISNFDYRLYGILEGLGLKAYFDSITISSEVGYAKPSPKLFAAALERHRLMPSEAVHVGDSEHLDVAGASAAGITAILLSRKPDSRSEFKQRKVSSLGEVISLLPLLEESSGGR